MLKKLMITAGSAAILAAGATVVGAAGSSQDIELSTTVTTSCTIDGSTSINAGAFDVAAGFIVGTAITVPLGNSVCNTASNVKLITANGAATTASAAALNFENVITYTAEMTDPAAVTLLADNTLAGKTATSPAPSGGPTSGPVSVVITPDINNDPLVAGTYADTLTVEITPTT